MTAEGLKIIISRREGTEVEFKESRTKLATSVFETICAFLNRRGGHIILGAKDNGTIVGVDESAVQDEIDTLAKCMNNPQMFFPTFYLSYEKLNIEGKNVVYFYVPESSQAHRYKGDYYDRNQDGDFKLKNNQQIADLFLRKQNGCTENRVLPFLTMDDLEVDLFDTVRKRAVLNKAGHPWETMSNDEILVSAGMKLKDVQTGLEGYTLAAALLFGKENTLKSVVPFYRTDALCRKNDTILYDDRDLIQCNLLRAYDRLIAFVQKHLNEHPYIDGMQRISLRDVIFREVCLNILIHREYGNRHTATFTIYKDRVKTENWNIPFNYGLINLENLRPHAKNPTIANFFFQLGIVEELGSGIRKLFKYTPLISDGQEPVIEENDIYKITIPIIESDVVNVVDPQNDPQNDPQKNVLSDRQKTILELIRKDGNITVESLTVVLGKSFETVRRDIRYLVKNNIIEREGSSKNGKWIVK